MATMSGLTPREQEVVALICDGWTDKEIAAHLDIGCVTVRTYAARACEKLGAANRAQMALNSLVIEDRRNRGGGPVRH
jgi:DNA-binding NarL/FixJ family response regulator